jgi:hypothetical protein
MQDQPLIKDDLIKSAKELIPKVRILLKLIDHAINEQIRTEKNINTRISLWYWGEGERKFTNPDELVETLANSIFYQIEDFENVDIPGGINWEMADEKLTLNDYVEDGEDELCWIHVFGFQIQVIGPGCMVFFCEKKVTIEGMKIEPLSFNEDILNLAEKLIEILKNIKIRIQEGIKELKPE